MADLENRQDRLEDKFHELEHRQYDFQKDTAELKKIVELSLERMNRMDEHMARMEERMNEKFDHIDEKFDRITDRLDQINNSVHNIALSAMIGIGAMVVSVVAFVGVAIYRGG